MTKLNLDNYPEEIKNNTLRFRQILKEPENDLVLMFQNEEVSKLLKEMVLVNGYISRTNNPDVKDGIAAIHVVFQYDEKRMAKLQKVTIDADYWVLYIEDRFPKWEFYHNEPLYRLFDAIDWDMFKYNPIQ